MVAITKSNINGDGTRFYGYLSTLSEAVVMTGELTSVPDDTIRFLLYTLTSGTEADVKLGMEVEVFDAGTGLSKGRLRAAGPASGGNLQINEFSLGRVNIGLGDEIRVYRSFRVHDRLVRNTPQFERDSRYAYSDQLETFDPIACSGGVYANFVSKASAVGFRGADSRVNDPDSSGSLNHDWTFPSGTPSTSVFANNTVDYSGAAAGTYMVTHEVEDDSNNRTATQYIPVILHDDNNPPFQCLANFSANREEGDPRVTFTVVADAITDLPDGALVVFWLDEHFNTTNTSYGNEIPSRSHIKFVGYLVKNTAQWDWESNTVTFDAISPLGILKQLAGSSQAITAASDPDSWLTMEDPTVNRVIWYLLYWNCTILLSHDLLLPADSPLYPAFYVQEADFYGQVRELADAVDCQFVCSRTGRLHVNKPLGLADASERSAATTVITLDDDDIVSIEIVDEHRTSVNLVEGRGITEGLTGNAAVFSRYPGNAPMEGAGRAFFERKIVRANPTFQGDLNARTGRSGARINSTYFGKPVPRGIRVTLRSGYDVFDAAYSEWVVLNVSDLERGIDFQNTRCTLQEVSVAYDAQGARVVELLLDAETDGVDGVTYTPPEVAVPTDPPVFIPPAPPVTPLGRGTQLIAMFTTTNELLITRNFLSGDPTWTALDLTALANWGGGNLASFVVDAYSPRYTGTGTAVHGWIATTTHVQRITDIFGTPALGTAHALTFNTIATQMQFERGVRNWGIVVQHLDTVGGGTAVAYTTDGATWTNVTSATVPAFANYDTGAASVGFRDAGLWLSPHTPGLARISVMTSTGLFPSMQGYQTPDYGATWTALSSPDISGFYNADSIVTPYANIAADRVVYGKQNADTTRGVWRAVGTTKTDITPVDGSARPYGTLNASSRSLASSDSDANTLILVGVYINPPNQTLNRSAVFLTRNLWESTPAWTQLVPDVLGGANFGAYMGDRNLAYIFGANGLISLWDGTTVYDKRGNLSTAGRVVGLCGG